MLFKRYYDDKLAQASYLIACEATGEAIVVDPNRDIHFYLQEARREGVRLRHVTETHIHADFVSGSRELAAAARAELHLSGEGGAAWQYRYARASGASILHDGDVISIGNVRIRALHTPGHTPEHLSFLVTDASVASEPVGMLSGDFLFAGDVGRPDLLERAAGEQGTMTGAARQLFASLRLLAPLPDFLQVWPGHGAGSACGKSLGSIPQSTLGYERIANWALRITDEEVFVREVLSGQPAPPRYFAEMKRINRDGPAILGGLQEPRRLGIDELVRLVESGVLLVDARPRSAFAEGHVQGSVSIPLNRAFTKWAGSILPYDRPFVLAVDDSQSDAALTAARDLAMIGLDNVVGQLDAGVMREWAESGRAMESLQEISAESASGLVTSGAAYVLDVRDEAELVDGTLPGAHTVPLASLPARLREVPAGKPVIVYCQGGSRSHIAASLIQAGGSTEVFNLAGGFPEWRALGSRAHARDGSSTSEPQEAAR